MIACVAALGAIEIGRVIDVERARVDPYELYANVTPELVARYRDEPNMRTAPRCMPQPRECL